MEKKAQPSLHVRNDSADIEDILSVVKRRDPDQTEFIGSVREVLQTLTPVLKRHPQTRSILKRLVEPERVIMFRVPWMNDQGIEQVNRGFRVQFNSALGIFKGGLRFHPTVNLGILKFLAFEQTLKNALQPLPLGGAKGGSDFDPKGKSDSEILRFCQAFAQELSRYIGNATDVPAGDIGVGPQEIGYMFGMFRKIRNTWECAFTGKNIDYGGSHLRPQATGYGLVYFTERVIRVFLDCDLRNKRCMVSGSGNVALYTARKLIEKGAVVLTLSDSNGTRYFPRRLTELELGLIMDLKFEKRGRLAHLDVANSQYFPNEKPWTLQAIQTVDFVLPCATQNEIEIDDAKALVKKQVKGVFEGGNLPSTIEAIHYFHSRDIIHAPSKASNIGGAVVSGFEMAQNAQLLQWTPAEVDAKLQNVMLIVFQKIADACERFNIPKNNLYAGANIAAFEAISKAMLEQGII